MGLFDKVAKVLGQALGIPDPEVLKSEQAAATIAGIRTIMAGHPEEGLDPYRLAVILKGAEMGDVIPALDLAESMEEKYLHYRSVLATRKLQVSALPIQVEAASTDAIDQRAADITREVMDSATVKGALFDMLDAIGKGYSVSEIIWDQQATEWRPDKILWRRPQWFVPDRVDGTTILLRGGPGDGSNSLQIDPAEAARGNFGTPLPFGKYITHIHRSKSGIPIRGALSRPAAWAYMFQNFTTKSWAIFLEVYGHPLRLGKYNNSASREEKATLLRAVRNISMDAAAIIPDTMSIDFIDPPTTTGGTLHQGNLDWWNNQISKLVLGQTGTSDTAAYVGTADAHEHVRGDIRDDDGVQLATPLVRDLARPLIMFNIGTGARLPKVTIGEPESEDVTALVGNVKTFVALGGRVSELWLAGKLGVPEPAPDDILLAAPAPPPSPFAPDGGDGGGGDSGDPLALPGPGGKVAVAAQLPQAAAPVNDALDALQAEQLADWQPLVSPMTDPVAELLEHSTTMEEFQAGLAGLMKDQDPAKLAEMLARSAFAARLAGLTGAPIAGDA
jgi:phage gp29-like protein